MEELTRETTPHALLPPTTHLGYVHLTVANLERQLAFYSQVLGYTLHRRKGAEAFLGTTDEVLLRLTEVPTARRVQRAAGMYHFALLYPTRKELAQAVARVFAIRYPNSPTDHGISETTYLEDLEGNTIELYIRTLGRASYEITDDNQLVVRYANGQIGSGRDPLDLESLFAELDENDPLDLPLPNGTRIGHIHLYASTFDPSHHFYRDVLGFAEGMVWGPMGMGDVGLDATQNHVIAWNTWKGEGIPPEPLGALGMRYFTIVLPSAEVLQQVLARLEVAGVATEETAEGVVLRDPSGIQLMITTQMLTVGSV